MYGSTELLRFLSSYPPVERSTDTGAAQSDFHVLLFVGHRILENMSQKPITGGKEKNTLIMVRRALAAPKAA